MILQDFDTYWKYSGESILRDQYGVIESVITLGISGATKH